MPFEAFKGTWKIQTSSVRCQPGEIVAIGGAAQEVLIRCGDEPYLPGKYFDRNLESGEREKIENKDMYTIFFIDKDPKTGLDRIQADFKGGQIGGSWIAEDNAGRDYTG